MEEQENTLDHQVQFLLQLTEASQGEGYPKASQHVDFRAGAQPVSPCLPD